MNIFIIGIDGAGSAMLDDRCVNIKNFIQKSTVFNNATTVFPPISAQAWGSLLLSVLPEKHGYTNNSIETHKHEQNDIYPSLFRYVKENNSNLQMASICRWNPINIGVIENYDEIIKQTGNTDEEITNKAIDYINNSGDCLLFIHLDDLDHAGHEFDYFTDKYMDVLPSVDKNIGAILNAIETSGKMKDSLIFLVSDHGGGAKPKAHGENDAKDMNIAIIAYGNKFEANAINSKRVSIMDITPTILQHLNITLPLYIDGKIL